MNELKLSVNIAGVEFKNPIGSASGTFASGREYGEFFDINDLGFITTKGVSYKPWKGNHPPRIAETYGGMLNSIGLQNGGAEAFMKNDLPYLKNLGAKVIVNVCGHTIEEYCDVINALRGAEISLLELNISCPNICEGGLSFGTNPKITESVVRAAKDCADKPLIVKLSPNVTDITEIARAAEAGGADGLSLINTVLGMRIDINKRKPILANKKGGLSGPAIKPIAVRMIYEVFGAVKLPIIGMGGVMNGDDAVELMLAGASAVAVGMASFHDPFAAVKTLEGLSSYADKYGVRDINELVGAAHF